MALISKGEEFKNVPWFSLNEWHRVYEDVYSNDICLQTRGYETLLAWKGRIPKLPVGVDCTLSLMQVCLRDRETSAKINTGEVPLYYENDLCLMYSTVIMRFLNQISNVGHTKQTSLFQIAKQLKIPEWIVNLRHDSAHGHQLPSLNILRMAANILLAWLHDEYWRAEAESLESSISKLTNDSQEIEDCDNLDSLIDLMELWVSVSLYIEADFTFVSELPDDNLRANLKTLSTLQKSKKCNFNASWDDPELFYRLTAACSHLLLEISTEIRQKNVEDHNLTDLIVDFFVQNEAFFPSSELLEIFSRNSEGNNANLLQKLVFFWQPLIGVLVDVDFLETFAKKLMAIVNSSKEERNKRKFAAFWLKAIGQGLLRLKIAQKEGQTFEHSQKIKKTPQKIMNQKVQEIVDKKRPDLRNSLWFTISTEFPRFFMDDEFISEAISNADEFTPMFIEYFLDLMDLEMDFDRRNNILEFLKIQTVEVLDEKDEEEVIHTVDDLRDVFGEEMEMDIAETPKEDEIEEEKNLFDRKIRNSNWQLAPADFDWENTPLGVLPWQIMTLKSLEIEGRPPEIACESSEAEIIPGFVDKEKVLKGRQVNWNNVLRKSLRRKRKRGREANVVMGRAIKMAKSRKV